MSLLPLVTDRLELRLIRADDVEALVDYRNEASTARYQDWPLPYTRAHAVELVDGQQSTTDVVLGSWVQVALLHRHPDDPTRSVMVGDLGLGLDDTGGVASIGYTLDPAWRGRGLAREAVVAVVDALFSGSAVHRIVASLDPQNAPSERLLVAIGFTCEGIVPQSAFVRGEWVDDLVYSLARSDWPVRRPG